MKEQSIDVASKPDSLTTEFITDQNVSRHTVLEPGSTQILKIIYFGTSNHHGTVYWEIFLKIIWQFLQIYFCNFEILITQKCFVPFSSMIPRWLSLKIYSQKEPILRFSTRKPRN